MGSAGCACILHPHLGTEFDSYQAPPGALFTSSLVLFYPLLRGSNPLNCRYLGPQAGKCWSLQISDPLSCFLTKCLIWSSPLQCARPETHAEIRKCGTHKARHSVLLCNWVEYLELSTWRLMGLTTYKGAYKHTYNWCNLHKAIWGDYKLGCKPSCK